MKKQIVAFAVAAFLTLPITANASEGVTEDQQRRIIVYQVVEEGPEAAGAIESNN
jgi:hypothetical protein